MKLAIIGTAGRKEDAGKLSVDVWNAMRKVSYKFVLENNFTDTIISGGAAYADHLAVILYNMGFCAHLQLALPARFDIDNCSFEDSGNLNWRENPGGTSNFYHKKFSEAIKIDSLSQIRDAIKKGAEVVVRSGFMERNEIVAKAGAIFALTFGEGRFIKDGGTADTVRKHIAKFGNSNVYHCDLNTMIIHNNASIKK